MSPVIRNYCLDCDWSASVDDHSRQELSQLALEHSLTNEHDIDSDLEYPPPA